MIDHASEMAAFVRVVDSKGFSAAAGGLGHSPSAVSKLVTRLETRLGVRLLQRTTRALHLTAEGEAFYAAARRIERRTISVHVLPQQGDFPDTLRREFGDPMFEFDLNLLGFSDEELEQFLRRTYEFLNLGKNICQTAKIPPDKS